MSAPAVMIHAFTLRPDDLVEITYSEGRDTSDVAALMRTVIFERTLLDDVELEEVQEVLREFVDTALLAIRNPPPKKTARREPVDDDE